MAHNLSTTGLFTVSPTNTGVLPTHLRLMATSFDRDPQSALFQVLKCDGTSKTLVNTSLIPLVPNGCGFSDVDLSVIGVAVGDVIEVNVERSDDEVKPTVQLLTITAGVVTDSQLWISAEDFVKQRE